MFVLIYYHSFCCLCLLVFVIIIQKEISQNSIQGFKLRLNNNAPVWKVYKKNALGAKGKLESFIWPQEHSSLFSLSTGLNLKGKKLKLNQGSNWDYCNMPFLKFILIKTNIHLWRVLPRFRIFDEKHYSTSCGTLFKEYIS